MKDGAIRGAGVGLNIEVPDAAFLYSGATNRLCHINTPSFDQSLVVIAH